MPKRPRKGWDQLAASTRKRYLSKGKTLGQTEPQVKAYYESGGDMSAYRGHRKRPGTSERQWSAMVAAAKRAKLDQDTNGHYDVILESLLAKGFTPSWIIDKLDEKADSRGTYRSTAARALRKQSVDAGWQPGRKRYHRRNVIADIELFYYH